MEKDILLIQVELVTVTFTSSPAAGNIVYVKDYDGTFELHKFNYCTKWF